MAGEVPAARAPEAFSFSKIDGGEYVLFDTERLQYHTLNESAYRIWQLCDGSRNVDEIQSALRENWRHLSIETVGFGVSELGTAGLLTDNCERILNRRTAFKALAGVVGGALLPVVRSISQPVVAETSGR